MDEKACNKCGKVKPLRCFYRQKKMVDGHVNKCKECTKADVRKNRREKIDYYREYDRSRNDRPDRVAARRAYQKSDQGREAVARAQRAWSKRNARIRCAQVELGNALRDGRVRKAPVCMNHPCMETEGLQGHHYSYDLPLSVVWLCPDCHRRLHREFRAYLREARHTTNLPTT